MIRPSGDLQGFSFCVPNLGATMDELKAIRSAGSSSCSSSIRAPEQGVLPFVTEEFLRLGFVSDDPPPLNYSTHATDSLLGPGNFSDSGHLNPCNLSAQNTPYGVNIGQRGSDGNNAARFVAQNTGWYGSCSYAALFDGNEASSSQSNQGIMGHRSLHGTDEPNSVWGYPFSNTSLGRPRLFPAGAGVVREDSLLRERVIRYPIMTGPIDPDLVMQEEGSSCLLNLLDGGDIMILENILNGILVSSSSLFDVMKHRHGSRFFEKLLDCCENMHKKKIVFVVASNPEKLLQAAKDHYGNFSITKLLASVKESYGMCRLLTSALRKIAYHLMTDALGSSLIKYCLEHLSHTLNYFIFETVLRNCHRLARHRAGIFTLKLCIEKLAGSYREQIVIELAKDTIRLTHDSYGNYIIQYVLSLKESVFTKMICTKVAENLVELSLLKTGSYVVQRCLESSEGRLLCQKLVNLNKEVLEKISTHPFGNYVLQTALKVKKDPELHSKLVHAINQSLKNLKCCPYATNVLRHAR